MINYYCPDFIIGLKAYRLLNIFQRDFPEMFNDNVNIKKVFGNFPNCTWNGGSTFFGYHIYEKEEIEMFFDSYKNLGIKLQLTMTNPKLEDFDCFDRYGNYILMLVNEFYANDVEILVSSPILEEYIRKFYTNIKISRSIVNTVEDYDFKEALKSYENIVIPQRYVRNFDFLNQFNDEERKRIEILCSDKCDINCPRISTHYEEFAYASLYLRSSDAKENPNIHCNNHIVETSDQYNMNKRIVPYNKIITEYVPKGFTEFKLAGRGSLPNLCENVVGYMIKPEFQLGVMKELIING